MSVHKQVVPTTVQFEKFDVEAGDKFLVKVSTPNASAYKRQEIVDDVVANDPCIKHIKDNGGNILVSTADVDLLKIGHIDPDQTLFWTLELGSLNRNQYNQYAKKLSEAINTWFPNNQNAIMLVSGDRKVSVHLTKKHNFWTRLKYLFNPKSLK